MTKEEKAPRASSRDHYKIAHRGAVFHFFWPFMRYVVCNISALFAWVMLGMFNRTIVRGRENATDAPNTVYLPNHQSMIDGFLVGAEAFFPRSILKPRIIPWLPAAQENFFNNPLIRFMSDNWKCIPVKPGRKDFTAMRRMEACLKTGSLIVFPEGTRTRDGNLLPPRSGIGFIMLRTQARAIPVCMDGMNRVLPVGHFLPRLFQTVYLYFGKPVDLSEFYDKAASKENAREIAQHAIEKVFADVHRMKKILGRYRRYRKHLLRKSFYLYKP